MRKALIIGNNAYTSAPLNCCIDDANAINALLKRHENKELNFSTQLLTDAHHEEMMDAIAQLFSGEMDSVLLYYSGHGLHGKNINAIVPVDYRSTAQAITMSYIMDCATNCKSKNKIIILDCCHAGSIGTATAREEQSSALCPGLTILAACRHDEYAVETETSGHGIFTQLLIEGLKGGAADLSGAISPGSLYTFIDKSLGPWDQRPVFKTNVDRFCCLRKVQPPVPAELLRNLTTYFPVADAIYPLNPSYEFTNTPNYKSELSEPYAIENNVQTFKELQQLERVGLVVPHNEQHMYFAAMHSTGCKLTPLGRYYHQLASAERI